MYREEQLLLGDLANSQLGHCDENDYCRVHLGYTFLFWSEMDAPLPSFYFFPSSLLLLLLSIRHEILIFDQWKSIHILLSELRNSEGREDSNSTLRSGYSWGILFSTTKLYFCYYYSRYPVLNVHHWTQKKLEGEWHPLHPWLIFGL